MTVIAVVAEGIIDYAVAERLVQDAGALSYRASKLNGRSSILANLRGYNRSARQQPWLILCDLDDDDCAPAFKREYLPRRSRLMAFRIAVREIEAWLLADPGLAEFLHVPLSRLPANPELERDPKQTMLGLIARSRSGSLRADLLSKDGTPGALYNASLAEFVDDQWDPRRAAERSDSLRRAVAAVEWLAGL